MKSQLVSATLLAFFLFFGLAACADPAPTAVPATSSATMEAIAETESEPTATTAVPTNTPPTNTPEVVEPAQTPATAPTETAAAPSTGSGQAVPTEPVSYTIAVTSPQPNQAITVAQEFTFSGTISPVPSQRLELELVAAGTLNNGESLLTFVDVDPATGNWQITQPIHPRRTGPATLHVRVAGTSITVPVRLQLAEDETSTIVTVNQPLAGQIVVAGQTLLISGESRNLIDDNIQVGLFGCPADTDENLLAQIAFDGGNGPWHAQIILPETAAANCSTARLRVTTGGLTSNNPQVAWASDQLLTLVTSSDERANLFTVLQPTSLQFSPGRATVIIGTAVNPVGGLVQVELVQGETVLARETAVPDRFGYWETSLTPPADTEPGDVQLRLSTGTNDTYRETLFPATLGS